jgi:ribosomal protein S18 acetylase RimI-like enzyme
MIENLSIRAMRPGEEAAVIAVWQSAGLTRPHNEPGEDIEFCRRSGHGEVLVGLCGEVIHAALMVGHDGHRGTVYYVGVAPASGRSGFGGAMMAAAETWLKAKGIWKLNLLIRAGNEPVARFYESCGYERQSRIYMEKWLEPERMARAE